MIVIVCYGPKFWPNQQFDKDYRNRHHFSLKISLDLDLYEKAYLLVHSNSELRSRFILCLSELHIVFAHIRGIGSYVSNFGLDTAWIHANWFDSPCLLRQVLECLNMKHAVSTLESTVITIGILVLDEVITDYPELLTMR